MFYGGCSTVLFRFTGKKQTTWLSPLTIKSEVFRLQQQTLHVSLHSSNLSAENVTDLWHNLLITSVFILHFVREIGKKERKEKIQKADRNQTTQVWRILSNLSIFRHWFLFNHYSDFGNQTTVYITEIKKKETCREFENSFATSVEHQVAVLRDDIGASRVMVIGGVARAPADSSELT